jgi:hypothetical protein
MVGIRTIRPIRSNESRIPHQSIPRYGEIISGGDGDTVAERSGELVILHYPVAVPVLAKLVPEPRSWANSDSDFDDGAFVVGTAGVGGCLAVIGEPAEDEVVADDGVGVVAVEGVVVDHIYTAQESLLLPDGERTKHRTRIE